MKSIKDGDETGTGGSKKPRNSEQKDVHSFRDRGRQPSRDTTCCDAQTIRMLLDGDEAAYNTLVQRYNTAMIRVARIHVPSLAVAEEVAQEAWLAFLQGLGGFKGRSSLKTWLFGILINRAKTRGGKERRSIPFSAIGGPTEENRVDAILDSERLECAAAFPGVRLWGPPRRGRSPEEAALDGEMRLCLESAIARLSSAQRVVLILRDIEGWSTAEVCTFLEITPENQRIRLHRARTRVRDAIDRHFQRGNAG